MRAHWHRWLLLCFLFVLVGCQPAASPTVAVTSAVTPTPIDQTVDLRLVATGGGAASIAVETIALIDSELDELGRFDLGSTALQNIDLVGWSEPSFDPSGVSYRFAEGAASIGFEAPAGTSGIVLRARSNTPERWIEVRVSDDLATEVRLTLDWRQVYVPIGDPVPIQPSGDMPVWTTDSYFPSFPETDELVSIRVLSDLVDWFGDAGQSSFRIHDSYDQMTALTLVGMQGVINRSNPNVYLDWEDEGRMRDIARFWLDTLSDHVSVTRFDLEAASAIDFLSRRYANHFGGAVIYDPEVPDTINLATMLASLENRVILAPPQLEHMAVQQMLSRMHAQDGSRYPVPVWEDNPAVIDLRQLAVDQDWLANGQSGDSQSVRTARSQATTAIYQWVYDHLWPDLERRAVGVMSPGPPTSEVAGSEVLFDPVTMAARDYLIALKLPVLWLSPEVPLEAALFDQFLTEAPSPIPVLSFYNEEPTVDLASSHGNWVAVIPNTNTPISVGNLSVHGAVRPDIVPATPQLDEDRILSTLGTAPVISIFSSDGDAMQFQMDRGFHGGVDFIWENVRSYRFGWGMNPTLVDLAPVAWNQYTTTTTGASFVTSLSGAGYAYPQLMDEAELQAYLEKTAHYMDKTGIVSIYLDERRGEFKPPLSLAYYDTLSPSGFLGIFATFLGGPHGSVALSYPGVPTPVIRPSFVLAPGTGQAIMGQLLAGNPGETVFNLSALSNHSGQVIDDPDASGGQSVRFSRPDLGPCCMVASGPSTTLTPGDYIVRFRLKTPSNSSSIVFAQIQTLQQVGGGVVFDRLELSPSDFDAPNQFQDFEISFSLDEVAENVEVWIDYFGGEPGYANVELIADTIVIAEQGTPSLPRFANVFIGLVGPIDSVDADLRILAEGFADGGGIVLHPDEYLAALNPEYMLGLAERRLGTDHPDLAAPRLALEQGRYYESLILIRDALRDNLP